MKKIKLLPSIIMLALCLAVLGIGVYSATTGSNTISGTLTVNSAGHEVDISVYEYTGNTLSTGSERIDHSLTSASQMYGKPLGSVTSSRSGKPISLTGIAFNSDTANTFADVDMIDLVIAVTNKSSEDVGIYFWDGAYDRQDQVTLSDISANKVIYGHKSLNASDGLHNNIADAEYSFYHHLPGYYTMTGTAGTDNSYKYGDYDDTEGSGEGDRMYYTEFMHVYLRLKEAGFTSDQLTINLTINLNVEKYVPNLHAGDDGWDFTEHFVKIEKGVTTYFADDGDNTIPTHVVTAYGSSSAGGFNDGDVGACVSLVAVSIPTGVTRIGSCDFSSCRSLASIIIPSTVTNIDGYSFNNCTGIGSLVIPGSVATIGSSAFYGCTGLTSLNIYEGVNTIQSSAFYGCSGLTAIKIPNSVSNLDKSAFSSCTGLATIKVDSNNAYYDSRDNCNGIITKVLIGSVPANTLIYGCRTTTIPSTVTSIGDSAFIYCSTLVTIIIPGNVTSIGKNAFIRCSGLNSVTIDDGVISIGSGAFGYCTGLSSIFIPESVTTITASSYSLSPFSGCTSLVINCEILEANKPAGWGTYWNSYSNSGRCTTNWGQTR